MFTQIWEAILPILMDLLHSPAFISAVILIVGAILTVLKVPKWIATIILDVIRQLFQAVEETEELAKTNEMSSGEKLRFATNLIKNSNPGSKGAKKVFSLTNIRELIEKGALKVLQKYWKD